MTLHRKIGDHIADISRALLEFDQRLVEHKKSWTDFYTDEMRAVNSVNIAVETESRRLDSYETEVKRFIAREQYSKAEDKVMTMQKLRVVQSQEALHALLRAQKDRQVQFKVNMKSMLMDVQNMEACRIDTVKHASIDFVEAQLTVAKVHEENFRALERAFALVSPTLDIVEFIETNSKLTPDQQLQVAEPQAFFVEDAPITTVYYPEVFASRLGFSPVIDTKAWNRLFFGTWLLSQINDIDLVMIGHLTTVLDLQTHEIEAYLQVFRPLGTSSLENRLMCLLQIESLDTPVKQQIIKDELALAWVVISWTTDAKMLARLDLPECFHKSKAGVADIGFAVQTLDSNLKPGQRAPSVWQWPVAQWLSKGVYTAMIWSTTQDTLFSEAWRQYLDCLSCLWPTSWISLWLTLSFHAIKASESEAFEFGKVFLDLQKTLRYCLTKNEGDFNLKVSGVNYNVAVLDWTPIIAKETADAMNLALRATYKTTLDPHVLEALLATNEATHGLAGAGVNWAEELRLYGLAMASKIDTGGRQSFDVSLRTLAKEISRLLAGFAEIESIWAKRQANPLKYCKVGFDAGIISIVSGLLAANLQKLEGGSYALNSDSKAAARSLMQFERDNGTEFSSLLRSSVDIWVSQLVDAVQFDIASSVAADTWDSLSVRSP